MKSELAKSRLPKFTSWMWIIQTRVGC